MSKNYGYGQFVNLLNLINQTNYFQEKEWRLKLDFIRKNHKHLDLNSFIDSFLRLNNELDLEDISNLNNLSIIEEIATTKNSTIKNIIQEYYDYIKDKTKFTLDDNSIITIVMISILCFLPLSFYSFYKNNIKDNSDGKITFENIIQSSEEKDSLLIYEEEISSKGKLKLVVNYKQINLKYHKRLKEFKAESVKIIITTIGAKSGKINLFDANRKKVQSLNYSTTLIPNSQEANSTIDLPYTFNTVELE
jgi:hypothetical protein